MAADQTPRDAWGTPLRVGDNVVCKPDARTGPSRVGCITKINDAGDALTIQLQNKGISFEIEKNPHHTLRAKPVPL